MSKGPFCTGILVVQNAALTALHCACDHDWGEIKYVHYLDSQGNAKNDPVKAKFSLIDDSFDRNKICKFNSATHKSPYAQSQSPVQPEQKGHDMVIPALQETIDEGEASAIRIIASDDQMKVARVAVVTGFGASKNKDFVGKGFPPATTVLLGGSGACKDGHSNIHCH